METKKFSILSYGAGVNSTAIIALAMLKEIPMPDAIVFSDTGAEYPYTYDYVNYIKGIQPKVDGMPIISHLIGGTVDMSLINYCKINKVIPSRVSRWCTGNWKIQPIRCFCQSFRDYDLLIGIDYGESHRAKKRYKQYRFPLIELKMNREECKRAIIKAGLRMPKKSGCYICSFQRRKQWIELKKNYPHLWKIAVELEHNSVCNDSRFTYITGKTLEQYVSDADKQIDIDYGEDEICPWCNIYGG